MTFTLTPRALAVAAALACGASFAQVDGSFEPGLALSRAAGLATAQKAVDQAVAHAVSAEEARVTLAKSQQLRGWGAPAAAPPRAQPVDAPAPAVQVAQARPALSTPVPTTVQTPVVTPVQALPGTSTTLIQIYQAALSNDAQLRAARAAADARRERLPQARAQLLPNISATFSRSRNNLESTTPGFNGQPVTNEQTYMSGSRALSLRQPIFRPFNIADVRQAQAQVDEANATLEREMQNLAVRVTTAYLQALASHDELSLVLAQRTAYTTQVEAARKRFEAGAGTRTDIDEAVARLDMSVARELEARQNFGYTRQQLESLTGGPVGDIALLDERRLPLVPPEPARVEDWIRRAEDTSPEIRALQAQLEAARREVQKAQSGHLPTLDAVAQWSISDSDNPTRVESRYNQKSVGIQANIPLYAGGAVSSQVRQAFAEHERVEQSLEATRRDLGLRVHREFRGVNEGVLRVRALEQAVRSAATVVESNRRSFQAGARTIVDVLNAEEQFAQAQRDLAEARYTYLLSRIRLRALAGEADTATIDEANGWMRP